LLIGKKCNTCVSGHLKDLTYSVGILIGITALILAIMIGILILFAKIEEKKKFGHVSEK
jgi:hypothetical protein